MRIVALLLFFCALPLLTPTVADAAGFCPDYGVLCYRSWTEDERPGLLGRFRNPSGAYCS
jgi:hypothetical protein